MRISRLSAILKAMSSPVKLASPYPTMEEAAEVYGISSSRLERLRKMVASLLSQRRKETASLPSARISARKTTTTAVPSRTKKNSQYAHTKPRASGTK